MRPSQSARKHGAGSSWSALAVSSTPKVLKEFQAQEVTGFSCRRNKPFPQFTKRTQATDLTLHPRNLNAFLLRICAFMGSAEKTQTEREREREMNDAQRQNNMWSRLKGRWCRCRTQTRGLKVRCFPRLPSRHALHLLLQMEEIQAIAVWVRIFAYAKWRQLSDNKTLSSSAQLI